MTFTVPTASAIESTKQLWLFLINGDKDENGCEIREFKILKEACQTQVSLSKFSLPSKGIKPLALNTLKAAAEVAVEDGGWTKLEQKRKELYKSIIRTTRLNPSRDELLNSSRNRLSEEKHKNRMMLLERAITVAAYRDIISTVHQYSSVNPDLQQALKRHEATFDIKVIADLSGSATNEKD